jgi:hypothetical protein
MITNTFPFPIEHSYTLNDSKYAIVAKNVVMDVENEYYLLDFTKNLCVQIPFLFDHVSVLGNDTYNAKKNRTGLFRIIKNNLYIISFAYSFVAAEFNFTMKKYIISSTLEWISTDVMKIQMYDKEYISTNGSALLQFSYFENETKWIVRIQDKNNPTTLLMDFDKFQIKKFDADVLVAPSGVQTKFLIMKNLDLKSISIYDTKLYTNQVIQCDAKNVRLLENYSSSFDKSSKTEVFKLAYLILSIPDLNQQILFNIKEFEVKFSISWNCDNIIVRANSGSKEYAVTLDEETLTDHNILEMKTLYAIIDDGINNRRSVNFKYEFLNKKIYVEISVDLIYFTEIFKFTLVKVK